MAGAAASVACDRRPGARKNAFDVANSGREKLIWSGDSTEGNLMLQRMIRAAKLDVDLYETVEHDRGYTGEAFTIVLVTAILWGVGQSFLPDASFLGSVVGGVIGAILGWVIWAVITNIIGKQLGGTSDTGEMLRVLGYSSSPMALGIIPGVGHFVGGVWALVAAVVAVRQGQDFSTGKAIVTIIIGWIVYVVARGILGFVF